MLLDGAVLYKGLSSDSSVGVGDLSTLDSSPPNIFTIFSTVWYLIVGMFSISIILLMFSAIPQPLLKMSAPFNPFLPLNTALNLSISFCLHLKKSVFYNYEF